MAAPADPHKSGAAAGAAAASPPPGGDPAGALIPKKPEWQPPPPPVFTAEEAAAVKKWGWAKVGRVAVAGDALELFNSTLARALAAPDADRPALMAELPLYAGCSRAASAAMEGMSARGALGPQDYESILAGLRLAEPILVRLAQARASPRTVKEVLALWLQEAVARMREPGTAAGLDERARALLDAEAPGARRAAANIDYLMNYISCRPRMERAVFSAKQRAAVADAPLDARRVFNTALAATLLHVRTGPNYAHDYGGWGGANDTDVDDARALNACLALERRLREAYDADQAAAATGAGRQAAKAARQARARAEKARKEAARCMEAARAARRGGPAGAPTGAPAGGGPELDDLALAAAVGDDESEGEYDMADSLFDDLELEEFQVSRPNLRWTWSWSLYSRPMHRRTWSLRSSRSVDI